MPVPLAWVLFGLCFGTSVPAESDAEFSQCRQSFYKQTPPVGFGGELQAHCHSLGTGQTLASLYSTSCDITAVSAFCLHKAWRGAAGHGQDDDGAEKDSEDSQMGREEDVTPVTMPALLKRDGFNIFTSSDTPANLWDALVSELVQNSIHPQCASLGGDLYVLTGRGSAGELGQGCEVGSLWSAMCCVVADEEAAFGLGVVKGSEQGARVLDVKELEEVIGLGGAIFSGGCGEADGGAGVGALTLTQFQNALQQIVETHNAGAQPESSDGLAESATETGSDALAESTTQSGSDALAESSLAESAAAQSTDAPSEEAEGGSDVVQSRHTAPMAEPSARASTSQVSDKPGAEPRGNSTLLSLLSWSVWLLTSPLRPVASTLTQIPGQVTHVFQEDLNVLSTLPGGALSIIYNVVADATGGALSAVGLAGKAGSVCVSKLYDCSSPLVGTLLSTCQDGVVGMGTLAWDGVGIFGGVANRAWSVSKFVGGRAWDQSKGFLWAVLGELGNQSKRAGGGLGKLALKGGNGLVNTVCMAGRIVRGTVMTVVGVVKEVFGDD